MISLYFVHRCSWVSRSLFQSENWVAVWGHHVDLGQYHICFLFLGQCCSVFFLVCSHILALSLGCPLHVHFDPVFDFDPVLDFLFCFSFCFQFVSNLCLFFPSCFIQITLSSCSFLFCCAVPFLDFFYLFSPCDIFFSQYLHHSSGFARWYSVSMYCFLLLNY